MTNATKASERTIKGRPQLFTSYGREMSILNTRVKRNWVIAGIIAMAVIPFFLQRDWVALLTTVLIFAIGGIGLNILTGYAGQVSLGQAFFMGVGAYTAAVLGGEAQGNVIGLGLDMVIWLPLAGLVPALVAFVLAPLAARVRGLYLAILTLGLVFIGEHIFKEARWMTGGAGLGRAPAKTNILGFEISARRTVFGQDFNCLIKAASRQGNVAWVQDNRFGIVFDEEVDSQRARLPPEPNEDVEPLSWAHRAPLPADPVVLRKI
jgi:branched-chain amino acid transport system permease protein